MKRALIAATLGLSLLGGTAYAGTMGGPGDDLIYGTRGADVLTGGGGDDVIYSGAGADIVRGGPGRDTCWVSIRDTVRGCEVTVGLTDA